MLGRFRSAIYNAIGNLEDEAGLAGSSPSHASPGRLKYRYQRPSFLKLDTDDEIQVRYKFFLYATVCVH
jgi:hypothetical protein